MKANRGKFFWDSVRPVALLDTQQKRVKWDVLPIIRPPLLRLCISRGVSTTRNA